MKSSLGGGEGRPVAPDLIYECTYMHANTVIDIDKLLNVCTCAHTQHIHSLTHIRMYTHTTHTQHTLTHTHTYVHTHDTHTHTHTHMHTPHTHTHAHTHTHTTPSDPPPAHITLASSGGSPFCTGPQRGLGTFTLNRGPSSNMSSNESGCALRGSPFR